VLENMNEPKAQKRQGEDSDGSQAKKLKAEGLKQKGNQALKMQDFKEAVNFYGQAIELDPTNHVYYSNRSAAYIKMGKHKEALSDANKCVQLNESWAKGYGRKGAALFGLKRYSGAMEAYRAALRFDPNSSLYKNEVESCKRSQQGKSTPSASTQWISSAMLHAIFYVQCIGHIILILSAIMSQLPTAGAQSAYQRTLLLAAILQAIIVSQRHGLPKFQKLYWVEVAKNNETHFIVAALLTLMSRRFFLGVAGHAMRSSLFLATGIQDLIQRGPRILSPLNTPFFMGNLRKLIDLRTKIYELIACMEVITGFMLLIEMLTPARNLFLLFAWWQYLRTRYVLSYDTKNAFGQIRMTLDQWLLHSTWCPSIIGSIYTKIKSFCIQAASPEAHQSRCTIM